MASQPTHPVHTGHAGHPNMPEMATYKASRISTHYTFDDAPMLVYWESTQACDLACIHCRAEAVPHRSSLELSTDEAKALFRQIAEFGGRMPPHLVITGGDPLHRPDLFELIDYAVNLGVQVSVTPAGTAKLTVEMVKKLKAAGVVGLGLSLDGSTPARHDAFRQVNGSFEWTTNAARQIVAEGIPLQVNTMVCAQTLDDLPAIYDVMADIGINRWALFFLIATGRGESLQQLSPEQSEKMVHWLQDLAEDPNTPFIVKTTEAPFYRRVALERLGHGAGGAAALRQTPMGRAFGIRDGNGVVFVSHVGQVFPSGFLPIAAGNVRKQSLVDIYRNSELFRNLRNMDELAGKCGVCPYRYLCGGSRARAYAETGSVLGSDSLCVFEPPMWSQN